MQSSDWMIGAALMLVGAVLTNLGNNLMSYGFAQQRDIDKRKYSVDSAEDDSILKSSSPTAEGSDGSKKSQGTWWLVGTIIFVLGALIVFLSFGFAAQSLLAALESVQFVSNVAFAKYIHGEMITRRIIISTICIIFGNILVVIFSSHKAVRLTSDKIAMIYLHNTGFHVYLVISGAAFFLTYGIWRKYIYSRIELNTCLWKHNMVETMSYIIYMSLIGSAAVLHSKNLSMLMQHCIQDANQFATPYRAIVWGELFTWIFFGGWYINRVNCGLSLYPPVFFIPVQAGKRHNTLFCR